MKKIIFETKNKVNFNTFLLSAIRFGREDKSSYKKKNKRWDINNNKINLLLLNRIIDEIYTETCTNWTLSCSEKTFMKLKLFNIEFLSIQKATSIIKYWF